jgi:hypothetical protein
MSWITMSLIVWIITQVVGGGGIYIRLILKLQ